MEPLPHASQTLRIWVHTSSLAGPSTIPMGKTVQVEAVLEGAGAHAGESVLLPFVNGRRWGAHERPDSSGRCTFLLPLPNPGPARIEVLALPSDTDHWMGLAERDPRLLGRDLLLVGRRMPDRGLRSNALDLEVSWRDFPARPPSDTLFCMQWESWFTTGVDHWRTTQAVPLVGFYDSYSADVTRQHLLWFMDIGVDFILHDWSNHIWGCEHWDERGDGVNRILHASELALEVMAQMRDEGLPVPKVALMPGLSNGPPATMAALNEELSWIYHTYLRNPRFEGLWQTYEGKPLVLVLDTAAIARADSGTARVCSGPHPAGVTASAFRIPFFKQTLGRSEAELDAMRAAQPPVDDRHFTVRWVSSQNQTTRHHELGYWSWMDGVIDPPVTYKDGVAEAVTVTPAFFNAQGWTGPLAHGRRGGATYLETFRQALIHRPKVVFLHQFNEFTGQPDGHGYGADKQIYVDTYSVELSDDLEPVSLTAPGYRGSGGWGFYDLNLTQALMDLYRRAGEGLAGADGTTLLAVSAPLRGAWFESARTAPESARAAPESARAAPCSTMTVTWSLLNAVDPEGGEAQPVTLLIDGKVVREHVTTGEAELALEGLEPGAHVLTVAAEGATTCYPLAWTELDELPGDILPVTVDISFYIA